MKNAEDCFLCLLLWKFINPFSQLIYFRATDCVGLFRSPGRFKLALIFDPCFDSEAVSFAGFGILFHFNKVGNSPRFNASFIRLDT